MRGSDGTVRSLACGTRGVGDRPLRAGDGTLRGFACAGHRLLSGILRGVQRTLRGTHQRLLRLLRSGIGLRQALLGGLVELLLRLCGRGLHAGDGLLGGIAGLLLRRIHRGRALVDGGLRGGLRLLLHAVDGVADLRDGGSRLFAHGLLGLLHGVFRGTDGFLCRAVGHGLGIVECRHRIVERFQCLVGECISLVERVAGLVEHRAGHVLQGIGGVAERVVRLRRATGKFCLQGAHIGTVGGREVHRQIGKAGGQGFQCGADRTQCIARAIHDLAAQFLQDVGCGLAQQILGLVDGGIGSGQRVADAVLDHADRVVDHAHGIVDGLLRGLFGAVHRAVQRLAGLFQRTLRHGLRLRLGLIHRGLRLCQCRLCSGTDLLAGIGQCTVCLRQCVLCHVVGGTACGIHGLAGLIERALCGCAGLRDRLVRGGLCLRDGAVGSAGSRGGGIGHCRLGFVDRGMCGIGGDCGGLCGGLLPLLHRLACGGPDLRHAVAGSCEHVSLPESGGSRHRRPPSTFRSAGRDPAANCCGRRVRR